MSDLLLVLASASRLELVALGYLLWVFVILVASLVSVVTITDGWDSVPWYWSLGRRAAARRVSRLEVLGLPPTARDRAVVLEARDRWLSWRFLGTWLPTLLFSFGPLLLLGLQAPPGAAEEAVGPITAFLTALIPLVTTSAAYTWIGIRSSPSWSSDAEVWRRLRDLVEGERVSDGRLRALRRGRGFTALVAALERDFMKMHDVASPEELPAVRKENLKAVRNLGGGDPRGAEPASGARMPTGPLFKVADAWMSGAWNDLPRAPARAGAGRVAVDEPPASGRVVLAAVLAAVLAVYTGLLVIVGWQQWPDVSGTVEKLVVPVVLVLVVAALAPVKRILERWDLPVARGRLREHGRPRRRSGGLRSSRRRTSRRR